MSLPITVILNQGSGHRDKGETRAAIEAELAAAGRAHEIHVIEDADELSKRVGEILAACGSERHIIAAAGGDGTINAVAAQVLGTEHVFGLIPMGTFNYFARDLGISLEPIEAVRVLCTGVERRAHVATVNDHLFLNNASFGLYRHLLEEREQLKQKLGRYKIVAVFAAVYALWRHRNVYTVQLRVDERVETLRTPMLFFGINALQLEKLELDVAKCTHDGHIAVLALQPMSPWKMLGLALRGVLQGLRDAPNLRCHAASHVEVTVKGRRSTKVAVDGESIECRLPLDVRIQREALPVMVPQKPEPRK
ncbi:MAG: diacylglycerol kinase family protein [Steroidobacteraceae bacterium]